MTRQNNTKVVVVRESLSGRGRTGGNQGRQKKKKKKRKRGGKGGNNLTAAYARMIADPCNADMIPGIFGESLGQLNRCHKSITLDPAEGGATTCGYFLWCPEFHNSVGAEYHINTFWFTTTNASAVPLNTTTNPWGSGGAAGIAIGDPAYNFVNSALVVTAATVSSCLDITYTGTLDTSQGEICLINGISLEDIVETKADAGPSNPNAAQPVMTVNEMFSFANSSTRLGLGSHEVIGNTADTPTFASDKEGPIHLGTAATNISNVSEQGLIADPLWYGFAIRGLTAAQPITVNMTKIIEWKQAHVSGFARQKPVVYAPETQVPKAKMLLNKSDPNWATRLAGVGRSMISQAAAQAAGPAGNFAMQLVRGYAMNQRSGAHGGGSHGPLLRLGGP